MHSRLPVLGCVVAVAAGLAGGCAWCPKPYAKDPLVRSGQAYRATPYAISYPALPPDPQPPLPPEGEDGHAGP
jgi:hypothetical protein